MLRVSTAALLVFSSACSKSAPSPETPPKPLSAEVATTSASGAPAPDTTVATTNTPPPWTAKAVPLPAGTGPAFFDIIAYDRASNRVFVPGARDVGALDVYDIATASFTRVGGFKTLEQEKDGRKRTSARVRPPWATCRVRR